MSKLADKLSSRRLKGPEAEPIILSRKRIYILPTRYGVLFTLLLLIMLIGSINYNNSLGFALTFLMGSVAIISMLHIHRNLSGVEIKTGTTRSVFSGQNISFPFIISNTGKINKYAIVFLHNPEKTLIEARFSKKFAAQTGHRYDQSDAKRLEFRFQFFEWNRR